MLRRWWNFITHTLYQLTHPTKDWKFDSKTTHVIQTKLKIRRLCPASHPLDKQTVIFIKIDRPTLTKVIVDGEHIDSHTNSKVGRTAPTRRRSVIDGRGEIGRGVIGWRGENGGGGSYGRGVTSDGSYPPYQPTSQRIDWRDTVQNMMSELKTDIINEVQQSVSTQIKELALTFTI